MFHYPDDQSIFLRVGAEVTQHDIETQILDNRLSRQGAPMPASVAVHPAGEQQHTFAFLNFDSPEKAEHFLQYLRPLRNELKWIGWCSLKCHKKPLEPDDIPTSPSPRHAQSSDTSSTFPECSTNKSRIHPLAGLGRAIPPPIMSASAPEMHVHPALAEALQSMATSLDQANARIEQLTAINTTLSHAFVQFSTAQSQAVAQVERQLAQIVQLLSPSALAALQAQTQLPQTSPLQALQAQMRALQVTPQAQAQAQAPSTQAQAPVPPQTQAQAQAQAPLQAQASAPMPQSLALLQQAQAQVPSPFQAPAQPPTLPRGTGPYAQEYLPGSSRAANVADPGSVPSLDQYLMLS